LDVTGDTTLNNNVTISGGAGEIFAITDGSTDVFTVDTSNGNTVIEGSLTVNGSTDLGNITVTDLELDTLTVNTSITDLGTLSVTGVTTTNGLLNADGGIAVDGSNFTVDGTTGDTSVNGFLGVTGETFLDNDVHVNSPAILYVGTKLTPEFNVDATGNITTAGTLNVTGTSDFTGNMTAGTINSSTITTTGNASVGGTLSVTGAATMNANLSLAGGAGEQFTIDDGSASIKFSVDSLTGNTVIEGNLTVNGSTNIGDISGGDVTFDSVTSNTFVDTATLAVSSTSVFTGLVTANGGVDTTVLTTSGNATVGGTLGVTGNTTLSTLTTTGTATMAEVNATNITASGTLGVTGNTQLTTVTTSGLATLDSVTVTNNATVGGNLAVTGTSGFTGLVTAVDINSTTLDASGNVTVGGTLGVTGQSTFNDTMTLIGGIGQGFIVNNGATDVFKIATNSGDTLISGTLGVTGVTATTTLSSSGLATLNSLAVTNNATIGGDLTVTGNLVFADVAINGVLTVTGSAEIDNIQIDGNAINAINGATEIVINEPGADVNFRVEGTTNENLLVVDAGTNSVNIGTATPITGAALLVGTTDSVILPKGTTAERPTVGIPGMLRYNTSANNYEFFDGDTSDWAEFGVEFTVIASETFNGDGSNVAFSLATSQTTASCIVSINGTIQHPVTAYGVSGTVLTFTEAPSIGDVIEVREITTTTSLVGLNNGTSTAIVETLVGQPVVEITGDLNPVADSVQDLGSPSKKWKDLYLSGASLYLNDIQIKNDAGTIKFLESDGVTSAPIEAALDPDIDIVGGTF